MDLLSFALLTFSSIIVLIDPITVTLVFVSLIKDVDRAHQRAIARDASLYALVIRHSGSCYLAAFWDNARGSSNRRRHPPLFDRN